MPALKRFHVGMVYMLVDDHRPPRFHVVESDFQVLARTNTGSTVGEPVFHVFDAIAHFEWRLIAERTKSGTAVARLRGERLVPLHSGFDRLAPNRARSGKLG